MTDRVVLILWAPLEKAETQRQVANFWRKMSKQRWVVFAGEEDAGKGRLK